MVPKRRRPQSEYRASPVASPRFSRGAKITLSSTPKEPPSSPQLSRIPRFARRPSATPVLDQDGPTRSNSQVNLSSISNTRQSPAPEQNPSPNNSRLSNGKKRLSVNDLSAESRRNSIPTLVISDRISDKVITRSHSRRPSLTDSGNGISLSSSLNMPPSNHSESGRSSPRRRSSFSIDHEVAKREGVISYTPQIRSAPVSDPGRVQVFVRVRPRTDDEEGRGESTGVCIEDQAMTQLKVLDGKNDRLYQFDGILPETATNREVFKVVAQPLLHSALSGFNGILMCYGQTGTGKTYTLMSNDGMTVRVIHKCFRVLNKDKKHRYTVTCSYLQIYQDKIYDLLNATRTVDLSLREHPKRGVYVENLTEYVVHSPKEVLNLLKVGRRRLIFAETQMNRASSRSHAICELRILKERAKDDTNGIQTPIGRAMTPEPDLNSSWNMDITQDDDYCEDDLLGDSMNISKNSIDMQESEDDDEFVEGLTDLDDSVTSVRGKIYICDLAGSERIKRTRASGERLSEAQHINSSLLELGNVIQALAEGHRSHVPFRNSTLTRLLQEGLSGNCKTRLVVCVAPTVKDVHETKCSLNFGSRAMKVQVTAHVNYEVDYKKLAECLAAKLESLESDWNVQKGEYERFIQSLKIEIASRQGSVPKLPAGIRHLDEDKSTTDKTRVQSLLVLELMTLQLFYCLQGKQHLIGKEETGHAQITILSSDSKDMLMQSMEGLLQLLNEYERGPMIKDASRTSSTGSSAITSPDYIEHNISDDLDVSSTLEPVARFLEHAQQIENSYKNNVVAERISREKTRRVLEQLAHLKESISASALEMLHKAFDFNKELADLHSHNLTSVEDMISSLNSENGLLVRKEASEDVGLLENSLYYLLMDKALLNCILLIGSHSDDFADIWSQITMASVNDSDEDRKRIMEELLTEKREKDQMKTELYNLKEEREASQEKLKDLELELKTVRELKGSLETKLFALESKNVKLEEQIEKVHKDKADLEMKILDIEKKKVHLENSLKSSENNNAKKERMIVDLRNEKVALDSIVSTLKDELAILEKEKVRDRDERKRIEHELDDVKDRNIILETEWSCCKEENSLLETELTALEEDKADLEDELSKYREDVKMLEEALDILQKEAKDYKCEIKNLKSKEDKLVSVIRYEKERFTKELSAMKQEISTLRVEKRKFQRDISVSKADRSNTERAYSSLKTQKDALQGDISTMRHEEKRLHRELAALRNDKAKLEREVSNLKAENSRLKTELATAEKLKADIRIMQRNEEKLTSNFKQDKDKLNEEMKLLKDKYGKLETDFNKLQVEKDKIWMQLKRFQQNSSTVLENKGRESSASMRSANMHTRSCSSPDKKYKAQLANRPTSFGSVTEIEGKVLDLQRRLAFFMAEKEDMQKELIVSRENNRKLSEELRTLEQDTSHIQNVLSTLNEEKTNLQKRILESEEAKKLLETERDHLSKAVKTSKEWNEKLQIKVDEICERNRLIESDRNTLEQSMKRLHGESSVLTTENKHLKQELNRMENEVKGADQKIRTLNEDYETIQKRLRESETNAKVSTDKVLQLQTENLNLSQQLKACKEEEKDLMRQLASLTEKFNQLERKVEEVLIERTVLMQHSSEKRAIAKQTKELREANGILEQNFHDLRLQIEKLNSDMEDLKDERKEVEKLIEEFKEDAVVESNGKQKSLVDALKAVRVWILGLKEDKATLLENITSLESQLKEMCKEKDECSHVAADKAARIEQEKASYQEKLRDLYKQLENAIKDKKGLQAEIDFLRTQNSEVRAEIAIVLEENERLEKELEELEDEFEMEEKELDAAKEETKSLLRQLCSVETKNLELCTDHSNIEEDIEILKEKCDLLKKENIKLRDNFEQCESEKITLHDRMLMAELEVSRMKVELESLYEQRKNIESKLIAAEKEKEMLKNELTGLARALSPLKKEVKAAVEKQAREQFVPEETSERKNDETIDIADIADVELEKVQEELAVSNIERAELEEKENFLQRRVERFNSLKTELREKLHDIITELCNESGRDSPEPVWADSENEDRLSTDSANTNAATNVEKSDAEKMMLKVVGQLIEKSEVLKEEEKLLNEELEDAKRVEKRNIQELSSVCGELQSAQENLSLAMMDRMHLSHRVKQIGKDTKNADEGDGKVGIKEMQKGIDVLKGSIKTFEKSGRTILTELKQYSSQLDHTENNLVSIGHYKCIIESNLREYRERNAALEGQLKMLHDDLVEMEERLPGAKRNSTHLLLETISLQKQYSSLEDDLSKYELSNEELKAEAKELSERFEELEAEKKITNTAQDTLEDSLESQQRKILMLQKDKDSLVYEKNKLQTKLNLFKDDKKRLLDDFVRLNKSLAAYAKYNGELEQKLETFKHDLSNLEQKASMVQNGKSKHAANSIAASEYVKNLTSNALCDSCQGKVQKKFLGVNKNTQLLGDELLDCIEDNMSLETAILTFIDQKSKLQEELMVIDSDRRSLENLLQAVRDKSPFELSDSQMSLRTSTPFMYCSGLLSTRSKSMTSHSGESFVADGDLPPSTPMRCHTALGICSSTSSLDPEYISGESVESLAETGAACSNIDTSSPNATQRNFVDEAYNSQEMSDLGDENQNMVDGFETVHEGELLSSQEKHAKSKNIAGFLKKFASSKRKRASKGNSTNTL